MLQARKKKQLNLLLYHLYLLIRHIIVEIVLTNCFFIACTMKFEYLDLFRALYSKTFAIPY